MVGQQLTFFEIDNGAISKTRRAERLFERLAKIREELNVLYSSLPAERPQITAPQDAAGVLMPFMQGLDHEELWVLPLDTRNRLLKIHKLYQGTLDSANVRVAEVFKAAILANACALIVAHNHPSGDPTPSPADVALTRTLVQSGRLLDIEVLDHLVIGRDRWVSLKAQHGEAFGV